jgi:hypothetical protein
MKASNDLRFTSFAETGNTSVTTGTQLVTLIRIPNVILNGEPNV